MSSIRTPDQRLRVFISSTIEELKEERNALREAIEALRLTPVFFEAGARPHPPRELYRAYLEQSDIFIGIYAKSYGWVAPDMSISGLEDEYRLCANKPKLIYIKEVDGERDERLIALIDDIRSSGAMSYQKFRTSKELAELVRNDLAIMLSERFAQEGAVAPSPDVEFRLPRLRGPSIGREEDVAKLTALVLNADVGLVTVIGAGGTGKSRLTLELAHAVVPWFKDGVCFIPLASLKDPALVASAIATHIGVYDNGQRSSAEVLQSVLFDKQMLLVLDNFEQLLPAATLLSELLDHCPGLKLLVSSRAPLHLRGEHVYPLPPLRGPDESQAPTAGEMMAYPSVQLFVQRAREASAGLELNEANMKAIAGICRKLDGLPLAIELAAARTRMMSPVALYDRMEQTLGLLDKGARDLPERQRTMRATIGWSYDLLDEDTRVFFRRLAVLNDRWTIEDAGKVAAIEDGPDQIISLVEQLVDQGLVRAQPTEGGTALRFNLLHVVREFAQEQLDAAGERPACERRHAEHFSNLAAELDQHLPTRKRNAWLQRVEDAYPDLRAAIRFWTAHDDRLAAWKMIGDLRGYWAHAGMVSEAIAWAQAARVEATADPGAMPPWIIGRALTALGLTLCVAGDYSRSAEVLKRALPFLEASPTKEDRGRAMTYLGLSLMSMGDTQALPVIEKAVELTRAAFDDFDCCLALSFLCEIHLMADDMGHAKAMLQEAGAVASRDSSGAARGMYLQQKANLLLIDGDVSGAEQAFREGVDVFDRLRMRPLCGWSVWGIGYTALLQGRIDESRDQFADCMSRARNTNDLAMVASATLGFAMVAHERGQLERSARLFGAAEHLAATIHYSFWSTDRMLHTQLREHLRKDGTSEPLRAHVESGKSLTTEATIALALA